MAEESAAQEEQIKKIVEEVVAEQNKTDPPPDSPEEKTGKFVVACSDAHNVLVQTMNYSLKMGGKFVDPPNYNKLQDCDELCTAASSFVLRESEQKKDILKLLTKLSEECVKYCDEHSEETQMQTCKKFVEAVGAGAKEVG